MKERLIGAAVLVGLGVWLIPWVLDGPNPEAPDPSTALNLPVPDDPLPVRRQTLRLGEEPVAESPPVEETAPNLAESRVLELPLPPSRERPADAEAAAAEAPVTVEAPPPAAEAPPPAPTAAREPPPEPATARAEEPPRTAPRAAAPAPAPAAAPAPAPDRSAATAPGEGWDVQLGSFSEEENARRLAQRVSTFGYTPQIANFRASGRTMYRVRVGPHATRGEAQAAASALSAHGFVAQVVTAQ